MLALRGLIQRPDKRGLALKWMDAQLGISCQIVSRRLASPTPYSIL